jgi:hypothetical protein
MGDGSGAHLATNIVERAIAIIDDETRAWHARGEGLNEAHQVVNPGGTDSCQPESSR